MADLISYREATPTISTSTGGLSRMGGGRWVETRFIGEDTQAGIAAFANFQQLRLSIREIIGFTEPHSDGIRLHRQIPKKHGIFPNLYAERLSQIQGIGRAIQLASITDNNAGSPFDSTALYPTYKLGIEYAPLVYNFAEDSDISTSTLNWTKPDGSVEANLNYAKEWYRYMRPEFSPAAEYIDAQAGQFLFDVATGLNPNGLPAGPGQLKMLVQKSALTLTWHEVPFKYIFQTGVTSYVERILGFVNQFDFIGYPAGTLLLFGVNIADYDPPFPSESLFLDSTTIFSYNRLCNVKFLFLLKNPALGKDADGNPATPGNPLNDNVIQAGHNLVPFAHTGEWYFAKTLAISGFTQASNRPIFPSAPFELLFTNPGVT